MGVRFAAAELIAAAPTESSRSSIGAKGLTGDGYKGHVFWDTDIFQLPFFAAVRPDIARRIVEYRVLTLDTARRNAESAGLRGAWYAWESAASGEDVTPSFVIGPGGRRLEVLTGHREIHVVADVAWAIETYVRTSGDEAFLDEGGGEVTAECARFFVSRAVETARGLEIHDVIGPDELHEQVNNSGFTNAMAAWTLRRAADLADAGHAPAEPGEPEQWRSAADRMVILRTEDGLIEEHEGFMELPLPVPPDERAGRDELAWQRDRMEWRDVKQADIVMLMALSSRSSTRPSARRAIACTSRSRATSRRSRRPSTRWSPAAPAWTTRPTTTCDARRRSTSRTAAATAPRGSTWRPRAASGRRSSWVVPEPAPWTTGRSGSIPISPRDGIACGSAGSTAEPRSPSPPRATSVLVEAAEGAASITAPGWTGEVHAGAPLRLAGGSGGWRAVA